MDRRLLKNLDFTLLAAVGLLIVIGLTMVYSATHAKEYLTNGDPFLFVKKQFAAVIFGLIGLAFVMLFDYRLSERACQILYGLNIVMLILVLSPLGTERNGAQSWLFGLQPSEFSKVIMIITLGKYLSKKENLSSFYDFIGPFIYAGIPLLLILMQPDFGTALVFIFFLFLMMYVAGAPGWKLGSLVLAGILSITLIFVVCNIFHLPKPLKEYQIARLTSFINPESDPQGSGWNVRQAMIAVGSGQFFGKGLFRGTQGRLGYLPENHTDFIFAVLSEELGFIGAFGVLFLFFTIIWRGVKIAFHAKDRAGTIIATGVLAMFLFHILENVGMNIGIMPITGIPLPFISSGGSSMISSLVATGLLLNIWARHQRIMF
ncbi:MAG TPA: rod shape-determining protein RodA [Bacillota bacterium]|nr:rod shape-determining protein RodA [Bacillota bacterium]